MFLRQSGCRECAATTTGDCGSHPSSTRPISLERVGSRERRKILHQRRELRRLNRIIREHLLEIRVKALRETGIEAGKMVVELRHLLGSAPWNAGFAYGLRLARDLLVGRTDVPTTALEYLSQEIGWRCDGKRKKP